MTHPIRHSMRALALTLALAIAGCSHGPGAKPRVPTATLAAPTEVDAILALLDQGDSRAANKRVKAALKRDPMNPSIRVLQDSIERDAKELLGPNSYPYETQPGDTMRGLAERFLGNKLKAYQLARYNDIATPSSLTAGQVLRIPGEAPRVAEPRPAPATAMPSPKPKAAPVKSAAPAAPTANPAAARQARAAGLAALNQGKVARAVGLLRRAAVLDSGNPVIARDLARAERIAVTVRARR